MQVVAGGFEIDRERWRLCLDAEEPRDESGRFLATRTKRSGTEATSKKRARPKLLQNTPSFTLVPDAQQYKQAFSC
jgi:hypothetical protein